VVQGSFPHLPEHPRAEGAADCVEGAVGQVADHRPDAGQVQGGGHAQRGPFGAGGRLPLHCEIAV
jgi:hypothetical protein